MLANIEKVNVLLLIKKKEKKAIIKYKHDEKIKNFIIILSLRLFSFSFILSFLKNKFFIIFKKYNTDTQEYS